MSERKLTGDARGKATAWSKQTPEVPAVSERKLPGGPIRSRPLHFIWIVDCSGSMVGDRGDKMQALNTAIRESIFSIREAQENNPEAKILIRAIKFSNGAQWHIATPTDVKDFEWNDLVARGETHLGKALCMVAEQLSVPPMEAKAIPPVLVLISDGQPTDNFDEGLSALEGTAWGQKAVRLSIAIGQDADEVILKKFMRNNPNNQILRVNNPEQLTRYLQWVSTVVVRSVGNQSSRSDDQDQYQSTLVPEPAENMDGKIDDIW